MESLLARLATLESSNQALEQRLRRAERRWRVQGLALFATLVGALLLSPNNRAAIAQGATGLAQRVTALESAVVALQTKTQFMSVMGGNTFFTNTNVHVQNGLGATNGNPADPVSGAPVTNGKGNLIIGYNASRAVFSLPDIRTGSHNLVVGDHQNFSSYGGLVAGAVNTISGPYASVSGGSQSTASASTSSVSGGFNNTASAFGASVSGGGGCTASGTASSVSGGAGNTAMGGNASVSGGTLRSAPGVVDWAAGGLFQDS